MADIKIYGTLKNDTAEPIAYASQVIEEESGKTVSELLAEAGKDPFSYMTGDEATDMVDEVFGS